MRSRSGRRAAWYGEALRLRMSSAPPAAWSAMGPSGAHASSHTTTPTRTPPMTKSWPGSWLAAK